MKFNKKQLGGYLKATRELLGISFDDQYNMEVYGITREQSNIINKRLVEKFGMCRPGVITLNDINQ